MTVFLPLDGHSPPPTSPQFLTKIPNPSSHVAKVVSAVLKAKRIAVVCGAGISVKAGIPDFRSNEGLFKTIKRYNPKEGLSSGKDLFDASVFNAEQSTSMFCQMIAQLAQLSTTASPTPFHCLLRTLDERGKLLRVYTQNIDALEQKAGLSFGIPEKEGPRLRSRAKVAKESDLPDELDLLASTSTISSSPAARLPSPAEELPRCIPLHGTLQAMHCLACTHAYPLSDHLGTLQSGNLPDCPECTSLEATRQLVGKRSRGVGKLRPSVVLYNEDHKDGECVGEVARKDLVGGSRGKWRAGADLLLVVGTSLRVPGTKRLVREFSKAVKSRSTGSSSQPGPSTSPPSSSDAPSQEDDTRIRSIYLNLDFPVPTRDWDGVFDVWMQGDAQQFAELVHTELERERLAKEASAERRRMKEENARAKTALALSVAAAAREEQAPVYSTPRPSPSKKRKTVTNLEEMTTPTKRKVILIVRPPTSPPLTPPKTPTNGASKTSFDFGSPSSTTPHPLSRSSSSITRGHALTINIPAQRPPTHAHPRNPLVNPYSCLNGPLTPISPRKESPTAFSTLPRSPKSRRIAFPFDIPSPTTRRAPANQVTAICPPPQTSPLMHWNRGGDFRNSNTHHPGHDIDVLREPDRSPGHGPLKL